MAASANAIGVPVILSAEALGGLLAALQRRGYEIIAPVIRDGALVYATVESLDALPAGWTAETAPGRYRLKPRDHGGLFGCATGPGSPKSFLHCSEIRLFTAEPSEGTLRVLAEPAKGRPRAFLGVRPCDLAAAGLLDRVLLADRYADPHYAAARESAFWIAVNCTEPAGTCFCSSMGTGPRARAGFDIVLTEMRDSARTIFVGEAGTERGAELLDEVPCEEAPAALCREAAAAVERASVRMGRSVETRGIRELLYDRFEHPRWEQTAARCLSCGNCTMVCPTCFCVTVEDGSDVDGACAWRVRKWDSCFTQAFSYIHGGSVRLSTKSRYRQWLTHKFAAWVDQFGTSGCVGCGRCIAWCPAGIDVTEELAALRGESAAGPDGP